MGVPYETPPMAGVSVTGGTSRVIEINFPSRSYITKLIVEQTDGVEVPFTVELFNHRSVLDAADQESDSVGEGETGVPHENAYRVAATMTSNPDGSLHYFAATNGAHGLPFFSQDGREVARNLGRNVGNPRKLYMRLTPQGTGDKRFTICIGGDIEVE